MVDFKEILAQNKPIIWLEIQKYLLKNGSYGFQDIVNEYPKRQGKYGRGTLVLLGCEAFGGDTKKAVRTAAAMQMSEDWLLIHDDWEDSSEERRGKPTLHRIYGDYFAINAGDALHIKMWEALVDNREILDEETTFRVLKEFIRFLNITAEGQHRELYVTFKKPIEETEYEDAVNIMHAKAAIYTISGPIRLGAIVAGQREEVLRKIDDFAIPLGIGFQTRDDILNIVGDRSKYGKEIGGDIIEGKRTLMLVHLIKNTEGEEHKKIVEIMNKKREERTQKDVEYVIELMIKRGSVDFAEKKAEEYARIAKQKFSEHFSYLPNKEIFETAIDFFALKRKV